MTIPVRAITSFRRQDWDVYARNFCGTFANYWPDIPLTIYVEPEDFPADWLPPMANVSVVSLGDLEEWQAFYAKIKEFPIMQGFIDVQMYSIRYDARMARKTFMEMHAAAQGPAKVFWVDADVVTFDAVTPEWLHSILPDNKLCAFLGRDNGPIPYTESGFLGFNSTHPEFQSFSAVYRKMFNEGLIFTCPGWHDCYAFDTVRRSFAADYFVDLGRGSGIEAPHVFINSILGTRMDHLKGNRKTIGYSDAKDLTSMRPEAYWQSIARGEPPIIEQPQGESSVIEIFDPTGAPAE